MTRRGGTGPSPAPIADRRPLTPDERRLARWMLEHGGPDARTFLGQLERARVVSRCPCGCASIELEVAGLPSPGSGMTVLVEFAVEEGEPACVFIYACGGVLGGVEVYGLGCDAPRTLPAPESLRRLDDSSAA